MRLLAYLIVTALTIPSFFSCKNEDSPASGIASEPAPKGETAASQSNVSPPDTKPPAPPAPLPTPQPGTQSAVKEPATPDGKQLQNPSPGGTDRQHEPASSANATEDAGPVVTKEPEVPPPPIPKDTTCGLEGVSREMFLLLDGADEKAVGQQVYYVSRITLATVLWSRGCKDDALERMGIAERLIDAMPHNPPGKPKDINSERAGLMVTWIAVMMDMDQVRALNKGVEYADATNAFVYGSLIGILVDLVDISQPGVKDALLKNRKKLEPMALNQLTELAEKGDSALTLAFVLPIMFVPLAEIDRICGLTENKELYLGMFDLISKGSLLDLRSLYSLVANNKSLMRYLYSTTGFEASMLEKDVNVIELIPMFLGKGYIPKSDKISFIAIISKKFPTKCGDEDTSLSECALALSSIAEYAPDIAGPRIDKVYSDWMSGWPNNEKESDDNPDDLATLAHASRLASSGSADKAQACRYLAFDPGPASASSTKAKKGKKTPNADPGDRIRLLTRQKLIAAAELVTTCEPEATALLSSMDFGKDANVLNAVIQTLVDVSPEKALEFVTFHWNRLTAEQKSDVALAALPKIYRLSHKKGQ